MPVYVGAFERTQCAARRDGNFSSRHRRGPRWRGRERYVRRRSRRRSFAWDCSGDAQSASSSRKNIEALREGLRDLGYVEGKNIAIEVSLCGWKVRAAEQARGRTGAVEGRRHRDLWHTRRTRGKTGNHDHPDCHGDQWRPRCRRACYEPRAAGWQRHRFKHVQSGDHREATRIAQGGGATYQTGSHPDKSRQSWTRGHKRVGACGQVARAGVATIRGAGARRVRKRLLGNDQASHRCCPDNR